MTGADLSNPGRLLSVKRWLGHNMLSTGRHADGVRGFIVVNGIRLPNML